MITAYEKEGVTCVEGDCCEIGAQGREALHLFSERYVNRHADYLQVIYLYPRRQK